MAGSVVKITGFTCRAPRSPQPTWYSTVICNSSSRNVTCFSDLCSTRGTCGIQICMKAKHPYTQNELQMKWFFPVLCSAESPACSWALSGVCLCGLVHVGFLLKRHISEPSLVLHTGPLFPHTPPTSAWFPQTLGTAHSLHLLPC